MHTWTCTCANEIRVCSLTHACLHRTLSALVSSLFKWLVLICASLQTSQDLDQLSCILLIVNTSADRPCCHGNHLNAPSYKNKKAPLPVAQTRHRFYVLREEQGHIRDNKLGICHFPMQLKCERLFLFIWWNKFKEIYFLHPLYFSMGGTILIESAAD